MWFSLGLILVAVTAASRRKYAKALRDIDEAVVLLGETLRDDAEA